MRFIFPLVMLMLLLASCYKDKRSRDIISSQDLAFAQHAYYDMFRQVHRYAVESQNAGLGNCEVVTRDTTAVFGFPKTININFGDTNCVDIYGASRRGRISGVFSGNFLATGTTISITPVNYYYEDHLLSGTLRVTYAGTNTAGNYIMNVVTDNARFTTPSGEVIPINFIQQMEWREGLQSSSYIWDDVFIITGRASGTNRTGRIFDADIETPLKFNLSCRWFVRGTFVVKPDQLTERTLDFDPQRNEFCDNIGHVDTGRRQYQIKFR